jgi:spermidine/putrescine transport system ATP-binding protein
MNGGRIEQIGSPAEVYDNPASAYVAGFIGQQNFFQGTVRKAAGQEAVVDFPGGTLAGATPAATLLATGAAVTGAVRPENVTVTSQTAEGHNQVRATLMGVSQLGSYLQVVTLTDAGVKILARTSRSLDVPTTVGTPVTCSWPASAVKLYPATDASSATPS